jgi:putative GTP pyrophosphokinase
VSHETFIAAFTAHGDALEKFAATIEAEIRSMLASHQITVHFVSSRAKSVASLQRKLARPEKTYHELWDVTDLVGIRIATYFEDTIEDVARLIEKTFAVDFRHSTDKSRFADAARFGYRSLHYVCSAPASNQHVVPSDFRFEIQVRTALQHAWAEVEHDLGYKVDAVPAQIRRRFSRVASLLEIADQEFVGIRRDMEMYQSTVQAAVANPSGDVAIDEFSLAALARTPAFQSLDTAVAAALQKPCSEEAYFPEYLVKLLRLSGLASTESLWQALGRHRDEVPRIIEPYFAFSQRMWKFGSDAVDEVRRGYGMFFLAHLAILRGPELMLSRVARLTALYQQLDDLDEVSSHEIANGLLGALGTHEVKPTDAALSL